MPSFHHEAAVGSADGSGYADNPGTGGETRDVDVGCGAVEASGIAQAACGIEELNPAVTFGLDIDTDIPACRIRSDGYLWH